MLRRAIQFIAWMFVLLASRLASGQTCTLYETGFESFTGPPSLTQGPFTVEWCLNGASVAASGFCPTGSALKLDASGDDPVLLVRVGDAACASVTVSFTYAQFVATGTVLKAGTTSATTVPCSPSTPTTIGTLSTTGGACTLVSFTVTLGGAHGAVFRFDHGANANAILIDDVSVQITDCCSQMHTCCEIGTPGCSQSKVEACVCAVDPYCCETAWDDQCVAEVDAFRCGDCDGSGSGQCLTAFATDFGTLYSTSSVCTLFPSLFESCEGSPPTLTISGSCAGSGDPALRFGTGFPYSAAITRCIDLSLTPAPVFRFRFTRNAGSLGPRIDYRVDGGEWLLGWQPSTGQGTQGCTEVELNLATIADATAVQFRLLSGSSVANGAAFDDLLLTSGSQPHDCCTTGMAGCTDGAIERCVCAADPYCCETAWDVACVALATSTCKAGCSGVPTCGAGDAGDCSVARALPFCDDAACCLAVCQIDPFCCESAWDELCVDEAATICFGASCGPPAGSCLSINAGPGCADPECCSSVCVSDPVCCLVSWDALCVAAATDGCVQASPADLDGNGVVSGADLAMLLAGWGNPGPSDLDGSGTTDAADLAMLLAAWSG
ncbi:MAG: hypothetical protein JNL80_02940 [Phycisphaerae bacterium]|jgi:hypothetical protein|nr:hypothetical protein [Phycisphaerae bacterium]